MLKESCNNNKKLQELLMRDLTYFTFAPSTSIADIGPEFPQVQKMIPGYDYRAKDSVHALSRAKQHLPDFTPNLNSFVLHSRSKMTDILSVSVTNGGFLISSKLKNILSEINLPTHAFYQAQVLYKKQIFVYYWLHIISDLTDKVNYPASTFYVTHNYSHRLGYTSIDSKEDLERKREGLKLKNPGKTISIWSEKIALDSDINFDLFKIGMFDINYYASIALKEKILLNNISGISLKEQQQLFFI